MVGFVLIVVLVVVGLMIFLIFSVREPATQEENIDTKNMLDSIMGYTTDCAIQFEPQYETIEELFKSAYRGRACKNQANMPAMDYLNETLTEILEDISKTEASMGGYELQFVMRDETLGDDPQLQVKGGNCTNSQRIQSAQRNLISENNKLQIRLMVCRA